MYRNNKTFNIYFDMFILLENILCSNINNIKFILPISSLYANISD